MTDNAETVAPMVCIYCGQSLVQDRRGYKDPTGMYQCQSDKGRLGGDVGFHVPVQQNDGEDA